MAFLRFLGMPVWAGIVLLGVGGCGTLRPTGVERTALAHSYLERAARLARSGQTERAAAAAEMAVQFDPHYLPARLFRGAFWLQAGEVEKALEEYETGVRLAAGAMSTPAADRAVAWAGRAACYARLGRWEEAAADYAEALVLFPEQADWRFELGKALFGAGRLSEAEEAFSAVLTGDSERTGARVWRAESRLAQGKYVEAADDYIGVLRERPEEVGLWRRLGIALLEAGLAAEAREALEKATVVEPKEPAVWTAFGMTCEATGDDAAAFRAYRRALELLPEYMPAKQGEQRVLERAQNRENR